VPIVLDGAGAVAAVGGGWLGNGSTTGGVCRSSAAMWVVLTRSSHRVLQAGQCMALHRSQGTAANPSAVYEPRAVHQGRRTRVVKILRRSASPVPNWH